MENWHAFVIGFQNNTSLLSSSSSESQHQFRALSVLLNGHVHHRGMDAPLPSLTFASKSVAQFVQAGNKCNSLYSEKCWMLYCLMQYLSPSTFIFCKFSPFPWENIHQCMQLQSPRAHPAFFVFFPPQQYLYLMSDLYKTHSLCFCTARVQGSSRNCQ